VKKTGLSLLALALVAGLLWWIYPRLLTAAWRPALSSRQIAARVLAEFLAKAHPGAKALVVGNPFTLRPGEGAEIYAFESASERGLREGFAKSGAVKVVFPELREKFLERPESVFVGATTTPLSYLVAEDSFQRLAQADPGFDLMVSLIGLPANLCQSSWWHDTQTPRLALLLPDWRKIVAAVIARPGASDKETRVRADESRAEFNRRFILVTKENIDDLLRTCPHAF
jgi:hypothetical protein